MSEIDVLEKTNIDLKKKLDHYKPKQYRVIFLNDDITPFEFVVQLLMNIFDYDREEAYKTTMKVHVEGKAIVGIFSYEVALQKQHDSLKLAKMFGYPLEIIIEEC
ncbi:MAG: ATP-dependent Clp protease adaptor ClpS [Candidatus Aenigmatarchaeota archaeon]